MSRGELHVSKWCRRTKDDRLRKEKKGKKGRNLTKVDRYLQGKRGVPTTGKFRLVAGNTIRAEARYSKASISTPITPIYTPFYIGNPKENPPFLRGEDFLRFFPEPFPGAITTATAITTAIITATTPPVIITTAATAIGNTLTKVKALPSKEIFQKVNSSISL